MDQLIQAAANHPMVVLIFAIIIVRILLKSFNQLN